MVVAGVTVIPAVVCPPGDHEYVPPAMDGVAVNVAELPAQIVDELIESVGSGLTVTLFVAVDVQPAFV